VGEAARQDHPSLLQESPPDSARFSGATSPTADGGPRMPVPQGEDVAAVLALAPPELRGCEPVVALERLIADRDEELAFLRERCVQFEVRFKEHVYIVQIDVMKLLCVVRFVTQLSTVF